MRGNTPCKMCCYRVAIFLLFLVCVFPCAIVVGSLGFVWWLVLVILCCPCWCVLCLVVQSEERRQLTRGVCCFWYIIGVRQTHQLTTHTVPADNPGLNR